MANRNNLFAGVAALMLLAACGHNASSGQAERHEEEADSHSNEIVFEKSAARAAGVRTETVGLASFAGVVRASGKILSSPEDETVVVANVSGIVHFNTRIAEGVRMEKGQTVFVLSAEHIQDGDPAARASVVYEAAKKDYERAARLVGQKIISEKEFNAVKSVYEEARIAYEATAGNRSADGTMVKVPSDGYVSDCMVGEGDYVTVGQPLMRIVRNRKLRLRADVAARHYTVLNKIVAARFMTSYSDSIYHTADLHGRLLSYGRTMADTSGYIPVIFEIDNTGTLLSGAFADIYLLTKEERQAMTVPLSAITEEQGAKFVYVQDDDDCYHKQAVSLGMSDGERTEVVKGLDVGDKVVTQGAVRVKLAGAGSIIPAHTHNH
ncbi:MAG: efflux RND transporter periplasmic adaptor subunit [Bacteroides sp.]|nr:efflux RND transporter periplasmic adaptor subunit [Roseburia sp.]MCM1347679.1 efflux RND transporter periplasmic adaptor subunit [Bacteroides sp.]MCM1422112.1 efflux RND transporter periplasmic adaptor subunit [Bacteroides sp.]